MKFLFMKAMKDITYKEFSKILKEQNFEEVRVKGSHHVWKRKTDGSVFTIPLHSKNIKAAIYVQFKRKYINI